MDHPTDRITHSTAFVTPVVEHWLEREMEHVMLETAKIGHNVKSKNLVDIPQCRDAITSTRVTGPAL